MCVPHAFVLCPVHQLSLSLSVHYSVYLPAIKHAFRTIPDFGFASMKEHDKRGTMGTGLSVSLSLPGGFHSKCNNEAFVSHFTRRWSLDFRFGYFNLHSRLVSLSLLTFIAVYKLCSVYIPDY